MPDISGRPSVRRIGGVAGIFGGLLFSFLGVAQVLGRTSSNELSLATLGLLAICEIGLARELARSHPSAAGCLATFLIGAGIAAVVGLGSLLAAGSLMGVAMAGIGVGSWFILAPVLALGCARAGLLGMAPASVLAVLTLLAMLASKMQDSPLVLVMYIAYGLAWVARNRDASPARVVGARSSDSPSVLPLGSLVPSDSGDIPTRQARVARYRSSRNDTLG